MVIKFGQMDRDTKDIGKVTKLMAVVNLFMLMEMFMKGNGLMTKLMVKVLTHMLMVLTIMEIGLMINNMVMGWSHGQMEPSMKVSIKMEKKMVEAN